jgi:hypothetical protein
MSYNNQMRFFLFVIFFIQSLTFLYAQNKDNVEAPFDVPYGGFKQGNKRGVYGKPFVVRNKDEAMEIAKKYFENKHVKFGIVSERRKFFIIEVLDENDNLIDVILIHKRSGRIRSIY